MAAAESAPSAPPGPPAPGAFDEARRALEAFWGRSSGGNEAFALLDGKLRSLDLDGATLRRLRLNLPVPELAGSPAAARIARAGQCLELLALERA